MKPSKTSNAKVQEEVKAKPAAASQAKPKTTPLKAPSVKTPSAKVPTQATSIVDKTASEASPQPKTPAKVTLAKSAEPTKAKPASSAAAKSVPASKTHPPAVSKPAQAHPAQNADAASPVKSMNVTNAESTQSPADQPATAAAAVPDQLVRATRPSARLAQITVPSLPPAVASTAAKSSFLPSKASSAVSVPFVPIKKDPKLANNWKSKKVDELSDAEILAMPDAEYMNDTQMAFFRLKLTQLKQEILNSAGQTTEHLREDTVVVPDPADRATIEEEHALELRTRDRERKLLKKIEQSIIRIDAGDYGFCDETGEAIGVGRLLARPTATLSLEAQQRRELKQKMFGD